MILLESNKLKEGAAVNHKKKITVESDESVYFIHVYNMSACCWAEIVSGYCSDCKEHA